MNLNDFAGNAEPYLVEFISMLACRYALKLSRMEEMTRGSAILEQRQQSMAVDAVLDPRELVRKSMLLYISPIHLEATHSQHPQVVNVLLILGHQTQIIFTSQP